MHLGSQIFPLFFLYVLAITTLCSFTAKATDEATNFSPENIDENLTKRQKMSSFWFSLSPWSYLRRGSPLMGGETRQTKKDVPLPPPGFIGARGRRRQMDDTILRDFILYNLQDSPSSHPSRNTG